MARASASVVGSGTVGPEPITAGSSPGTSEIARVTTRAGCARRASRPPLMRDRCFRTVLISPMLAPERSSARVTACLSASVNPSTGAIQLADAPPESSTSTRSSGPAPSASVERPLGGLKPGGIGNRMAGLDHRDDLGRPAIALPRHGDAGEPARRQRRRISRFRHLGHGARGLAGRQHDQPARRGGGGRCGGRQDDGCAAAIAVRNNPFRNALAVMPSSWLRSAGHFIARRGCPPGASWL